MNSSAMMKARLKSLYGDKKLSVAQISKKLDISESTINYWLKKFNIEKRSISDAIYLYHNPEGDPYKIILPRTISEAIHYGIGIGLYWGEGTKRNRNSVRLGNTDPEMILEFVRFLEKFFDVKREDLRFGLQIFSDMEPLRALDFWYNYLAVSRKQFLKVIISRSGKTGTYTNRIKHGVLTVYFHNTKLKNQLCALIENVKSL